jgi:hypothetical protein
MAEHGLAPVRRSLEQRVVHLAIDTTVTPIFGDAIEGALLGPNPKYHGRPSHHPVRSRERESGKHLYLWDDSTTRPRSSSRVTSTPRRTSWPTATTSVLGSSR